MSKMMLIDAAHAEETRVAVVDGNQVEEFDFESRAKKQLRGNIYLAKVTRVEPSLQAAFVEYGGNRHGFLAFNEVHPDYYQIPVADREALLREEAEDNDRHGGGNGNGGSHAHDGEDGDEVEDDDDVMDEEVERRRRRLLRRYKIQEVIKRHQIMLVQVVKDERGTKGASLTTYLSLAGRYGVLMPNTARGGGISRKISTAADRKRLKEVVASLDIPQGMGLIVRTAGAKRTKAEIKRDYEYLMRLWENIRDTTLKSTAPALIYAEEDLVKRAIRDMYDKDVDAVIVEGEQGYADARDFMRMIAPSQAKKVIAYREATPLFVKHQIENELGQIYTPNVPLKSGGYLVINQTEALVAIDVNSGKSTRERNVESTALKTNLEAADEAARQLRLRDLAGLIVIDFIDMDESKNNRAVEKRLADALKTDRARIQTGKISTFGLLELSRQRRRTGVLEGTTHVCPQCAGVGRVRSVESSALSALRAVELEAGRRGGGAVTLKLPRDVALYILNDKRAHLARVQQAHGLFVSIQIDDSVGHAEHLLERTSDVAHPLSLDLAVALPSPPLEADDAYLDDEAEEDEDEIEAEAPRADREDARGEARPDSDDGEGDRGGSRRGGRRRRRGGRDRNEPREEVAADAVASPGADEDRPGDAEGEGDPRRRRRRGRRGGGRAREGAPSDTYGWTRARTPDGADPYGWYDTAPPVDLSAPAPANDAAPSPATITAVPASVSDADIWVELPAEADKPKSRSRGRGRGKRAEALAEPTPVPAPTAEVIELPVAPAAEAEAPPEAAATKPKRTRKPKAVEAEAEPAPAQEAESAPEPVAPKPVAEPVAEPIPLKPAGRRAAAKPAPSAPDPAEITAPPPQPKRGWWRR